MIADYLLYVLIIYSLFLFFKDSLGNHSELWKSKSYPSSKNKVIFFSLVNIAPHWWTLKQNISSFLSCGPTQQLHTYLETTAQEFGFRAGDREDD